ncbi:hypothetical protein [Methyloceanibacter methanicus]|nr:hypothetical protein [Methyloceanibacter methanicus]
METGLINPLNFAAATAVLLSVMFVVVFPFVLDLAFRAPLA